MQQSFRDQAVRHKLNKPSGTVLNYSRWTRPVAGASAALSVGFLLLVVFSHYTRAVAISGYLVPEGGILQVARTIARPSFAATTNLNSIASTQPLPGEQ
jgi:hypothetical protein